MFARSWILWFPPKLMYWYCHQLFVNWRCRIITFTSFQNLWFWEYHIYRCCRKSMVVEVCGRRMFVNFQFSWVCKVELENCSFPSLVQNAISMQQTDSPYSRSAVFMIFRSSDFLMLQTLDLHTDVPCLPKVVRTGFPKHWWIDIHRNLLNEKCWLVTFAKFRNLWFWASYIYRCCTKSMLMELCWRRMLVKFQLSWVGSFNLMIVDFVMLPNIISMKRVFSYICKV